MSHEIHVLEDKKIDAGFKITAIVDGYRVSHTFPRRYRDDGETGNPRYVEKLIGKVKREKEYLTKVDVSKAEPDIECGDILQQDLEKQSLTSSHDIEMK